MGNNISKICGYNTGGDERHHIDLENRESIETKLNEKELMIENTFKDEEDNIKKIQSSLRQYKAKNKYNQLLIERNEREFEDNLSNMGTQISEEEMMRKISEKVISLEQTITPFEPTKEELKLYKDTFVKDPILLEDGSIYKGSWNSINMRKGYGVLINPQGFKYEGFWNNEKLNGRGRFIDDKGNYYEGKLLKYKLIIIR